MSEWCVRVLRGVSKTLYLTVAVGALVYETLCVVVIALFVTVTLLFICRNSHGASLLAWAAGLLIVPASMVYALWRCMRTVRAGVVRWFAQDGYPILVWICFFLLAGVTGGPLSWVRNKVLGPEPGTFLSVSTSLAWLGLALWAAYLIVPRPFVAWHQWTWQQSVQS